MRWSIASPTAIETRRLRIPAVDSRVGISRENWQRIFAGVPDITADVLGSAVDGDTIWSEWEMRGARPDGQPHLIRGVIIFGVRAQRAAWARFYLEPVDAGEGGVRAAISSIVDAGS